MVTLKTPDLDVSAIREAIRSLDLPELDLTRLTRLRDELSKLDLPHLELPHVEMPAVDLSELKRPDIELRETLLPRVDVSRAASAASAWLAGLRRPRPAPVVTPRRGSSRSIIAAFLALAVGAILGSIATMLLDPERGPQRRAAVRRRVSRLRGTVAIPIVTRGEVASVSSAPERTMQSEEPHADGSMGAESVLEEVASAVEDEVASATADEVAAPG